jgi:ABC-type transporter Mla maintaining outer membrane lipid asymmetry ATPase subunit MlaF
VKLSTELHITSIVVRTTSRRVQAHRIVMLHDGKVLSRARLDEVKNTTNATVRQFIEGRRV